MSPAVSAIPRKAKPKLSLSPNRTVARWLVKGARGILPMLMLWVSTSGLNAQELRLQRSPYSAWLDLRAVPAGAPAQNVPPWVESLECFTQRTSSDGTNALLSGSEPLSANDFNLESKVRPTQGHAGREAETGYPQRSIFRIRLARPDIASGDLQIRILFDDRPSASPLRVTAWDELGGEMMRSAPLGQGLDLPSSETLVVPMKGVNYLEIEASGDGSQVRGAFLTWLKNARTRHPADFPAETSVREPFHILSAARDRQNDSYLFGVVTAGLSAPPIKLKSPDAPSAALRFELERQPLVAVVTFEALGANVFSPPTLSVNGRSLGTAEFFLPDLADPAYRGEARAMESQMNFRYAGWLRGQKVIPGAMLLGGLNNLTFKLSNATDTLAVRSVEIQLKYNWEKFDYILSPVPIPSSVP